MAGRGADLRIGPGLEIPAEDLRFETTRSGGPGGQNVNKLETRVTLRFDVRGSRVLTDEQRARLEERLGGRVNQAGELVVHASRYRSQARNVEDARERTAALIRAALAPRRRRRRTRPTRASKERRLSAKKRRGDTKRDRRGPNDA